jgi:hypothetical protein
MRHVLRAAALAALVLGPAHSASAQSATFNFEDGTDQGFGTGFGDDSSASFTIANVAGSNRLFVPRTGFQSAAIGTGNTGTPFFQAMAAAAANEAGYVVSYDWYVDTANWGAGAGNYLQLGTYANTGSGFYGQHFPDTDKEVELNGTQLASGQVFSGHVVVPMTLYKDASNNDIPPNAVTSTPETFFRLGLIVNGDGAAQAVYYDNITISPAPEPTSLALLTLPALALLRRRRA